jgi:hypothetical protein
MAPRVRTTGLSIWVCGFLVFAGCTRPVPLPDAGMMINDAGEPLPTACSGPAGCPANEVCREKVCTNEAPCITEAECGVGERCTPEGCRFTGCRQNADCDGGICLPGTFTCGACTTSDQCPAEAPICVPGNRCVQCLTDEACQVPGPLHCSPEGMCSHCLLDSHCPNGLSCNAEHVCEGVAVGQPCPVGTACGNGLACVNLGGTTPVCARSCNLTAPSRCGEGETCNTLLRIRSDSRSFVFGLEGPMGVCVQSVMGARALGERCARSPAGSNCRGDLYCVPDSATTNSCRAFCNPYVSSTACTTGQRCVPFPGDLFGRPYGLCLPDDGFGDVCSNETTCRAGLSCQPYEDASSLTNLNPICQYNVGAKAGLAPCSSPLFPDGGISADGGLSIADLTCKSGRCARDPINVSAPFYCFAPCSSNADCAVGTREGLCDTSHNFTSAFGIAGSVLGCRPACTSYDSCQEYGAGFACRSKFTRFVGPTFISSCGPEANVKGPGEPCYADYHCRSGYCSLDDGRGAPREGYCSELCTSPAQCTSDAGVVPLMPMDCAKTPIVGFYGFDGKPATADDIHLIRQLCTGIVCADDSDCGSNGSCIPDADPLNVRTALVKRCKPANPASKLAGETCTLDIECRSSACGRVVIADGGVGPRMCFEACTGTTVCANSTTCRTKAMRFQLSDGTADIDSCVP